MSEDIFTPLLTTTDWNAEWKRLQTARKHADSSEVWDKKAKTFPVKHGSQAGYVSHFLDLADVQPGEAVLDMGCGTGSLATPLAKAGHRVIACDFSRGMLDVMEADQRSLGVGGVEVHQISWTDDWEAVGLGTNCVDVAIASRSIATYDLQEALLKLGNVARRRACITLPRSATPKIDDSLLSAAGFDNRAGRDFLYAFNILAALGKSPEVSYIPNTRLELFDSFDDALAGFSSMVKDAVEGLASEREIEAIPTRLRPWLEDNLVQDDDSWHLKHERQVTWAFIAWSTE
ncbi:MAG: class I SAM-dependent methyltransferase [Eggerthellaceae bacterium]|nr:class I SAM-dependent methyltransferase [Eggerthellaceae bacterium]